MRRKSREYYYPDVIQPVGSPHGLFVVLELYPLPVPSRAPTA
jgi:hypothetical protein